jgi:hypothetical protein
MTTSTFSAACSSPSLPGAAPNSASSPCPGRSTWRAKRDCALVQLTTDKVRTDAHRFYTALGFVATHEGMMLALSPDGAGILDRRASWRMPKASPMLSDVAYV